MKLIQFIMFFQLMLIGIVIGLDDNSNSTQIDNNQKLGNNNADSNQKNEDSSNKNNSDNNKDKYKANSNQKNEDSKEKESESKDNKESNNSHEKLDHNKSDENNKQDNGEDQENKPKDGESSDIKKNNGTDNLKLTDKDKLDISIQLLKPVRLEAVQGILFAIGDTVEFEWKWAKDKKPKKNPKGFNLLAVRNVMYNVARYPIATNLSSSTFKFTLDATLKNTTELFNSMPEGNDYFLYIYDSANGDNYLGTNGTFYPFNIRMKLYRSKTPMAFSFSNAKQSYKFSLTILILILLTILHVLL